MITVTDLSLSFGDKALFKDVNLKFTPGNCYGIIGANGAGKSTFLKILSGDLEHDRGDVSIPAGQRMAVLKQDHFAFDKFSVKDTVMMGYPELYKILKEREAIYEKEDFTEEDGIRASELEGEFAELGGWEAENQIEQMLSGLGLEESFHDRDMAELDESQKVRVLLAQAIFGEPDILLLDEPTNGLDLESISWLEEFLINFPNTVIVVSHDRHFLNAVCTHVCDIDFGKIRMYTGNYDFWYQMSQIMQRQARDQQKKREEKMKDLREFILRFSSNAAKSKQATSRKKVYDKLALEEIEVTTRKFPYVNFKPDRDIGNNVLRVEKLNYSVEGEKLLDDFSLTVNKTDKIAFVGMEHNAKSALFDIISGEVTPESGDVYWGQTVSHSYLGKDNTSYFESTISITDWLRQYSPDQDEGYVRGFLGRMLFSGDDSLKPVNVLSGGEKVRCMLSKMMLTGANILILDEPTNHLDLEAITSLNEALIDFPGVVLFNSHDHEFVSSIANRIVEITPGGVIDRMTDFESYITDDTVKELRTQYYGGSMKKVNI
ncbi:MAG TPA: ABC-F family ATP-binding cassette domain-containing protein [Treponemataceae bacterium]|jgi:ATPase subunit of ABC transporter with duplicated ATPase domains|nr:ABC-F family ATP-binding cassette domain-containing protein [Treponema sp.]OQB02490.1 MAG: putative ABC transporter ATP-binding protein YheS [Spirochaetes bacterium ADurb.Bin215]HPA10761.1 ABC-F family ATP-binding cassette domain-containing protein [Treponemataceae bacterium]HPL91419.1 ABC-F family ATP-binding cassette domain-containing protein [Treponemataceae bacterium]HQF73441.1 ABC-F family ATP-binding cassette domain-containing protein [Treponemataceae bacterium]